jgi:hypothetical protein
MKNQQAYFISSTFNNYRNFFGSFYFPRKIMFLNHNSYMLKLFFFDKIKI